MGWPEKSDITTLDVPFATSADLVIGPREASKWHVILSKAADFNCVTIMND